MHTYESPISSEWIDYNGHLRDAYYGLLFSHAVDAFMVAIGMTESYRARTHGTLYVAEDHRHYYLEIGGDSNVRVDSVVLDFDSKRIHLLQRLYAEGANEPASSCESMQLHVVQHPEPRVTAMSEEILAAVERYRGKESSVAGAIGIRRR